MKKGLVSVSSVLLIFISAAVSCFLQGCATTSGVPSTFVRTYSEPGNWRSIETREGMSKDAKWRVAVDALSTKFDIEVIDKESGYIRTSWKNTLTSRGTVDERYRSRIVLKFNGDNWDVANVLCEANWSETYEEDRGFLDLLTGTEAKQKQRWVVGYDTAILDEVYGDLIGRFSRVSK
jgi:hypothetical protein